MWLWSNLVELLLVLFLLVLVAYVVVRVASFAHFRTKLEYVRRLLRELKGEENGES